MMRVLSSVSFLTATFLAGFALLTMVRSLPAHGAAVCNEATQSPYVSLAVNTGRINYITTRNRAGLRRLNSGSPSFDAGWSPIGLTLAELGLGLAVSVRAEGFADGRYCAEIASVEATLGYDVIDVYIASEYPRGSCQYATILDHERLHVGIFQDTIDQYFSRVEDSLRRTANSAKPVLGRDPDRATRKLQAILERAVKPLFLDINKVLDRRNGALDTTESYEREQSNCLTW